MNTTAPHELSDLDFTKLQGQYQAKFGIVMNKQVILLFEAQKEASQEYIDLLENKLEEQAKMINDNFGAFGVQHEKYTTAVEKVTNVIESKRGQIVTENPKVVLTHNLSKYGIICTLILLLGGMLGGTVAYFYNDYNDRQEEYRKITNTLTAYPKIYKYRQFAQRATIEANPDDREGEYLILTIPKKEENYQTGKHYIYDQENERILVPLHFSKTPYEE